MPLGAGAGACMRRGGWRVAAPHAGRPGGRRDLVVGPLLSRWLCAPVRCRLSLRLGWRRAVHCPPLLLFSFSVAALVLASLRRVGQATSLHRVSVGRVSGAARGGPAADWGIRRAAVCGHPFPARGGGTACGGAGVHMAGARERARPRKSGGGCFAGRVCRGPARRGLTCNAGCPWSRCWVWLQRAWCVEWGEGLEGWGTHPGVGGEGGGVRQPCAHATRHHLPPLPSLVDKRCASRRDPRGHWTVVGGRSMFTCWLRRGPAQRFPLVASAHFWGGRTGARMGMGHGTPWWGASGVGGWRGEGTRLCGDLAAGAPEWEGDDRRQLPARRW